MVANDMTRKWVKRSDRILFMMIIMFFIGAVWGIAMNTASFIVQVIYAFKTIQSASNSYYGSGGMNINVDYNSILIYIGAPVTGGLVTWLIKNMVESNTKNKLNPEYLTTHTEDIEQ